MNYEQARYDAASDSRLNDPRTPASIRGEAPGYSNQNTIGAAKEPGNGSPIRDALAHHEQAMTELFKALDRLEHRLDPILTPMPQATATAGQGGNARAASELHARADQLLSGTVVAIQRIMAIADRIEL